MHSVQSTLEDTIHKKGGEIDLLMRELNQVGIKEKDCK